MLFLGHEGMIPSGGGKDGNRRMKAKSISNDDILSMFQPIGEDDNDLHLTRAEMSRRIAINKALYALAKLSPEKRAEVILNEAKRRGLV